MSDYAIHSMSEVFGKRTQFRFQVYGKWQVDVRAREQALEWGKVCSCFYNSNGSLFGLARTDF